MSERRVSIRLAAVGGEQVATRVADPGLRYRAGELAGQIFDEARAQDAANALRERARQVIAETRTKAEHYAARLRELNDLLVQGAIDQETYNRAVEQARQRYDEAGDGADALPDPTSVAPPSDVVATSSQATAINLGGEDGTIYLPRIQVTWTASPDAHVAEYEVEASGFGGEFTHRILQRVPADRTAVFLDNAQRGMSYTVRVRARAATASSSWAEAPGSVVATGDESNPAAPSGMTATPAAGQITIAWTAPSDADFRSVDLYVGDSDDPAAAVLLQGTIYGFPGDAQQFVHAGLGPGVTKFYWTRAVDVSGNGSVLSAVAFATTF